MSTNKRKINWIESAMINRQVVIAIVVLMVAIGIYGLVHMPRQEFPDFTIRQGLVIGVFPGATSQEVEEQLTTKVENYLFGFKEINKAKTYSHSREGMMIIYVELADDVTNADQFWSKLNNGLSALKMTLPSGVAALVTNSDFGDTSALLITLTSDSKSYKDLEKMLTRLEAEIRKVPAVSKIKHFGLQKEKIFVTVDPARINHYNVKPLTVMATLQTNGLNGYAGSFDNGEKKLPLHVPARISSEADLGNQMVYADPDGNIIRLKDVATIERRYDDPDDFIRSDGRSAVLLSLEMQSGNNIVEFGEQVQKVLDKFQAENEGVVHLQVINNLPSVVDDSISHFMSEFLMAVIAVILVTMLLLPFRVALVAAITIPISILMGIGLLFLFGVQLHTVSLAALIIVLGMVVDNSIVVIDDHVEKLDHGLTPWKAAWMSARHLFVPVLTATMAINVAFFPMMWLLTGTAGDFIGTFPVTIAVTLTISMLVAVMLVPVINYYMIRKGLKSTDGKARSFNFLVLLQKWYDHLLDTAFRHRWTTLGLGLLVVVGGIWLFTRIPQQLFPTMERNQFAVEAYLPDGTSLQQTDKVMDSLERILMTDKRVVHVTSFVGNGSPRFHTVYAPHAPVSNYGQLIVNTVSNEATEELLGEYSKRYTDLFAGAHIKFKQLELSKSMSPIEVRLSCDSIEPLKKAAEMVRNVLRTDDRFIWIHDDWGFPLQGVEIDALPDQTGRLGLTRGVLGSSMLAATEGLPLTTIWEGDYPVDVVLYTPTTRTVSDLGDQFITPPLTFQPVPLRTVASLSPDFTEGTIVRRNGVRTLTISADVERGVVASIVFDHVKSNIDSLALPKGVTLNYGGDLESGVETFVPMIYSLVISVLIIFFILLFQFRRINKTAIIMLGMVLAFPGAALGLWIVGYPFGLTSFIGIMGLCGMVVRNGIILVDYIEELSEEQGLNMQEAALAAGKRRMRPIFLTSAAAAVGVIPMIMSKSLLWGPLGTVICFGLLVAMVLTLVIMPVLYAMIFAKAKPVVIPE